MKESDFWERWSPLQESHGLNGKETKDEVQQAQRAQPRLQVYHNNSDQLLLSIAVSVGEVGKWV